ncbi:MAG TPA: DUF3696 domain-containing protein, partial [Longimicrobium sp.]
LLRQSAEAGMLPLRGLLLNGDRLAIGTAQDALFSGATEDEIGISIEDAHGTFSVRAQYSDLYADVLPILECDDFTKADLVTQPLHYLPAERIGPRRLYDSSSYAIRDRKSLGQSGEFAVATLAEHFDRVVPAALHHESAVGPLLLQQMNAWLGEISPGVGLHTNFFQEVSKVELRMSFEGKGVLPREFSAINVGFGLSYVLSIIVAVLSSEPGTLVLVENPEAHLHPRGQSAMGELLARAAKAGVQVIVESHSDHFLNGIRLAVKRQRLGPESVVIHYFERRIRDTALVHTTVTPQMDRDGRIDRWPKGFFDEYAKNLDALLG